MGPGIFKYRAAGGAHAHAWPPSLSACPETQHAARGEAGHPSCHAWEGPKRAQAPLLSHTHSLSRCVVHTDSPTHPQVVNRTSQQAPSSTMVISCMTTLSHTPCCSPSLTRTHTHAETHAGTHADTCAHTHSWSRRGQGQGCGRGSQRRWVGAADCTVRAGARLIVIVTSAFQPCHIPNARGGGSGGAFTCADQAAHQARRNRLWRIPTRLLTPAAAPQVAPSLARIRRRLKCAETASGAPPTA
jgi:hypothetical protein